MNSSETHQDLLTFPENKVISELICPICLDIMNNTMIVMECLHRFCSDCIQKCLRQTKHECPSCRVHISSRRALRRDENFDRLIQLLAPSEARPEEVIMSPADIALIRKQYNLNVATIKETKNANSLINKKKIEGRKSPSAQVKSENNKHHERQQQHEQTQADTDSSTQQGRKKVARTISSTQESQNSKSDSDVMSAVIDTRKSLSSSSSAAAIPYDTFAKQISTSVQDTVSRLNQLFVLFSLRPFEEQTGSVIPPAQFPPSSGVFELESSFLSHPFIRAPASTQVANIKTLVAALMLKSKRVNHSTEATTQDPPIDIDLLIFTFGSVSLF